MLRDVRVPGSAMFGAEGEALAVAQTFVHENRIRQAASSLGANSWQTFSRVIFPTSFPALLTGFTLAFARGLGEYGSIIFISGNMPMHTEITSLLIVTKLEQYDYAGATAIASVKLVASLALLVVINGLQARTRRFEEKA